MKDKEIRTALKLILRKQYSGTPNTLIVDELGIEHGRVRIDIAVVNGVLHGYELKSDRDTLCRLEDQASVYNKVFDRVTLVSAKKHAFKALQKIPDWWGIKIVDYNTKGAIRFHPIRPSKQNPNPNVISILELLWKKEALAFLNEINTSNNFKNKTKKAICHAIAEKINITTIREKVRNILRSRSGWRVAPRQQPYDDLSQLSTMNQECQS